LIKVPPEVAIRSTIRRGSVYYFPEDSFQSSEPHYFIVLNTNPLEDEAIFLVCASSKINKVKQHRSTCPYETLVEITPDQYAGFKVATIIDCNDVFEKSIDQLVDKLLKEELKLKSEMDISIVEQLREGVMSSPLVEHRIKALLQD